MRVKIGERLERRIERVYQLSGYSRKGDLVREATRQRVDELEAEYLSREQPVRDAFDCDVDRGGVGGPEVRLTPTEESALRFEYVYAGSPPHTTILDTGITFIPEETPGETSANSPEEPDDARDVPGIRDTLEAIEGVEGADVLTEGAIAVKLAPDTPTPQGNAPDREEDPVVDRIYAALEDLVESANRRVRSGEETREEARQRAVSGYDNGTYA